MAMAQGVSFFRIFLLFIFIRIFCLAKIINATLDNLNSSITYNGRWVNTTGSQFFDNSIVFTTTKGDNAVLNFTGTQVFVYGPIGFTRSVLNGGANSIYQVDDKPPVLFHDTAKKRQDKQLLFTSDELTDGPHTITITNAGDEYFLDFIMVTTTDEPPPGEEAIITNSTLTNTNTKSSTSESSTSSSPEPSTTNASANQDATPITTSPSRMAMVIGITLAAVITVMVIVAMIWKTLRRKREEMINSSFTRVLTPPIQSRAGTPQFTNPFEVLPSDSISDDGRSTWSYHEKGSPRESMSVRSEIVEHGYHV